MVQFDQWFRSMSSGCGPSLHASHISTLAKDATVGHPQLWCSRLSGVVLFHLKTQVGEAIRSFDLHYYGVAGLQA